MKQQNGKYAYVRLHWKDLVKDTLRASLSWLFVLFTFFGTLVAFIPEEDAHWLQTSFRWAVYHPWSILLVFLLVALVAMIVKWPRTYAEYNDKTTDVLVIIECCDLMEQDGMKVIHMVDTFDTELGTIINPKSVHGTFLRYCQKQNVDIDALLDRALMHYTPREINEDLPGRKKQYPLGTVASMFINDEQYCGVAFTRLQPNGSIEIGQAEYLNCLMDMWRNLADPRIRADEMNVAVMGNKLVGLPIDFTTEQKIGMMLQTFFAVAREKVCCRTLRICVHPSNVADIEFESLPTIMAYLAKRPVVK